MALESPLVSSPANMMSTFSPYTDFSLSPNSPAQANSPRFQSMYVLCWFADSVKMLICHCRSTRSSAESSGLRPNSIDGGLSPSGAQMTSPSDMVGPSPVTSNGTETTEIEDEAADEMQDVIPSSPKLSSSLDSQATVGDIA